MRLLQPVLRERMHRLLRFQGRLAEALLPRHGAPILRERMHRLLRLQGRRQSSRCLPPPRRARALNTLLGSGPCRTANAPPGSARSTARAAPPVCCRRESDHNHAFHRSGNQAAPSKGSCPWLTRAGGLGPHGYGTVGNDQRRKRWRRGTGGERKTNKRRKLNTSGRARLGKQCRARR